MTDTIQPPVTDITKLLNVTLSNDASDLHIRSDQFPCLRVHGKLQRIVGLSAPLSAGDIAAMLKGIMSASQLADFQSGKDIDFLFEYKIKDARFRINAFHDTHGPAIVLRALSPHLPELSPLGLPPKLKEMIHADKGLILVTGATGSGKSTSLAAMINELNKTEGLHIITIEDPVEYAHTPLKSMITHRELGTSTPSFASALKSALRQDPDVILIGELRDRETALEALHAAETGHLVMATVHTGSAAQAADRIVGMFPPDDKEPVRQAIASNLVGVLTQQLVKKADGKGRVAAAELLVATPGVKHMIREGKTASITSAMQTGSKEGMVTMDKSLNRLKAEGIISMQDHQIALDNYRRESGMSEGRGGVA